MDDEYIVWDYSVPGISFNIVAGRITIFKTTLAVLGFPEYYRFMFDVQDRRFAIQTCGIDDEGAKRMPELRSSEHCDIKSMEFVRFIYRTCGWSRKLSYRIAGKQVLDQRLVQFDLTSALEIHEGRLKEPTR